MGSRRGNFTNITETLDLFLNLKSKCYFICTSSERVSSTHGPDSSAARHFLPKARSPGKTGMSGYRVTAH